MRNKALPLGVEDYYIEMNLSDRLPVEAGSRFRLISFRDSTKIYALYDNHDVLLHSWPEDYIPGLDEIRQEVMKQLQIG